VADAARALLVDLLAEHQRQLDAQQLVEHQPLARHRVLLGGLRLVDPAERRRSVDEVEAVEHLVGHGVGELDGAPQRLGDPPAQVAGVEAQLVGLRVDRRDLEAVGLVEQVDLGVRHLLLAPEGGDLPEEHGLGALGELAAAPRLVEEGDLEVAGAVGDPQLGVRALPRPRPGTDVEDATRPNTQVCSPTRTSPIAVCFVLSM
jgi:hypothetical protein